jgi:putative oxidoreductase
MDKLILAGRILLAFLFIFSGAVKFVDLSGTAVHIAAKGFPTPMLLAGLAGAGEVIGGLMIAFGYRVRVAAIGLAIYSLAAGLIFHNFWTFEGREQINQMLHLFKNFSIIGGMLILAGFGAGRISLDAKSGRT